MTLYKYYLFVFLLLFVTISCSKSDDDTGEYVLSELGDVTEQVTLLGTPLSAKYADNTPRVYARNIWDMHAYGNKIYFGGGNSSNSAPAANAGPADLWAYDIVTQDFTKEYTVNDEQIHRIREFDNQLYIPGHDARESWSFGNFYRLEADGWKKYRTIPNAIHVYDIYKWENKLFAAIGPQSPSKNIQVSDDNGATWKNAEYTNDTNLPLSNTGRVYTLFPFSGQLRTSYTYPTIYTGSGNAFHQIIDKTEATALYDGEEGRRIERPVVFGEYTVYIVGVNDNDHQYLPLALLYAKNSQNVMRYQLLDNTLPRDILVKGKYLIVLLSKLEENGTYYNTVMLTSNLSVDTVQWKELFGFTTETFARSFEYLNGTFYFGLGCETDNLSQATGSILKFDYKL